MAILVYMDTDGVERSCTVGYEPLVVGRAPECSIQSSDARVSRVHARFFLDQMGTLWVEDLGSSNGVYVGPARAQCAAVPSGELVVVGSLMFRLLPPNGAPVSPSPGVHGTLAQWLEMERKLRVATEEERNAYGARMAEVHQEMRAVAEASALLQQQDYTLRQELEQLRRQRDAELAAAQREVASARDAYAQAVRSQGQTAQLEQQFNELHAERTRSAAELAAARATISQLEAKIDAGFALESRAATLASDLASCRERLAEVDEQRKSAEVRLRSAEEELTVARADVIAAEDRVVSELANAENRANAAISMRDEELAVARSDLSTAEERILQLSRTVSELEQRLAQGGR